MREAARDLVSQHDRLQEQSIEPLYQPPQRPEPDLAFFLERVQPILQNRLRRQSLRDVPRLPRRVQASPPITANRITGTLSKW